jgi:hypothetical protein
MKMPNAKELENYSVKELFDELVARRGEQLHHRAGHNSSVKKKLGSYDSKFIVSVLKRKQELMYGKRENISEFYQIHDQALLENLDSVAALFNSSDVVDNGDGTSNLNTRLFGSVYQLCPEENFRAQPVGAFSTGFLVANDIIASSGHSVIGDVTHVCFVFGYKMTNSVTAHINISNSQIHKGQKIIGRRLESDVGTDWALVKLDRRVTNHKPLEIRKAGRIEDGQSMYVLGHPCGLPVKFAGESKVRDNKNNAFFVANLDTFGGSTGSPVFNSVTHEVEGLLARGETDFVPTGNCNVSLICPTTGCGGCDCTRATEFSDLL